MSESNTMSGANTGFGINRRAQVAELNHIYLDKNHLNWWTAKPPVTSPIDSFGNERERYRAFLAEFLSKIASVVGDDVGPNDYLEPYNLLSASGVEGAGNDASLQLYPMQRIAWPETTAAQPSPVFRIRNAIVDQSPASFRNEQFFSASQNPNITHKLVVTADRNSFWIDFVVPQRAVGLQAGFFGRADLGIDSAAFIIEAWRSDGSKVGTATGGHLLTEDWLWNRPELIGIRDELGDIRTIHFYCLDPAIGPNDFMFIYRIWHEALPASVVCQGTVANFPLATFRGHQHRQHPDLPNLELDTAGETTVQTPSTVDMASGSFSFGNVELELPFGCDRAAVFLRGFKVIPGVEAYNRREPQPQKFSKLRIALKEIVSPTKNTPQFSFQLMGEYSWGEEQEERADTLIAAYWTVLAWRSDRVDIEMFRTPAAAQSNRHRRKSAQRMDFVNARPLAKPSVIAASSPDAIYGQLFGGLTSYSLSLPRPVEPQIFAFAIGSYGLDFPSDDFFEDEASPPWEYIISAIATGGSIGAAGLVGLSKLIATAIGESTRSQLISPLTAPLGYSVDGRRIGWSFITNLDETLDRDELATTFAAGTVVSGRSLDSILLGSSNGSDGNPAPTLRVVTLKADTTSRESLDVSAFETGSLEIESFNSDQAVVVMGAFEFVPEDEVRELDVEVRAAHFDGNRLVVALGSGVQITPALVDDVQEPDFAVGAGYDYDVSRIAIATPHVVGIHRVAPGIRAALASGNIEFTWADATIDVLPQQAGYLRNDGNIPVGIGKIQLLGPQPASFSLRFGYRGQLHRLDNLIALLPLTLMPGESLDITGVFDPAATGQYVSQYDNLPAKRATIWAWPSGLPAKRIEVFALRRQLVSAATLEPSRFGIVFGTVIIPFNNQVIAPQPSSDAAGRPIIGNRQPPPALAGKRAILTSDGVDPLVVTAMRFDPPSTSLSIVVEQTPLNYSGLVPRGALHVLDPGTSLLLRIDWRPSQAGNLQTSMVVETNVGLKRIAVVGKAILDPARPTLANTSTILRGPS